MNKIWPKITLGPMYFCNGVSPVTSAMQQTFAFLLKVLFDFFEKSNFFLVFWAI